MREDLEIFFNSISYNIKMFKVFHNYKANFEIQTSFD